MFRQIMSANCCKRDNEKTPSRYRVTVAEAGLGLGLGLVAVPHQNTDLHNSRHTSYESSRHGLSRYNRLRLDRLVGAEISVFEHL